MFEESTRLQIIRLERLKDLQTRHQHELSEFDTLSRRPHDSSTTRTHQSVHSVSSNSSRESGSSSPRPPRFNGGSSRGSDRSLGPNSRFPLPNRESSVSMTSLQSTNRTSDPGSGHNRLYSSQQSHSATNVTRTRNLDSRNGNVTDRLSYHDGSRR